MSEVNIEYKIDVRDEYRTNMMFFTDTVMGQIYVRGRGFLLIQRR